MVSMVCGSEVEARIYHGENEICKTEAEAREAAELLKAFFEAKQENGNIDTFLMAQEWHAGQRQGYRDGYKKGVEVSRNEVSDARREGYQTAMLEMQQEQTQPSDYQLRLERYAVDILTTENNTYTVAGAVDMAALIIKSASEKARENGTTQD